MQHCDKVMKEVGGKDWEVSTITSELTSEEVCLTVTDGIGWKVIFDTEPTEVSQWIIEGVGIFIVSDLYTPSSL